MPTTTEWAQWCETMAEALAEDGDNLGNGLQTVVADLCARFGPFEVLDAVSRIGQKGYSARGAAVEHAAVLVGYARKAVGEGDRGDNVSRETLGQLARAADDVAHRVAVARGTLRLPDDC